MSKLSEVELASFYENGFIILENAFDKDEVERMRQEADFIANLIINSSLSNQRQSGRLDIKTQENGNHIIRKIQPVNDLSLYLSQVSADDRLLDPMRQIMEDEPTLMEEKLNYKQPLDWNDKLLEDTKNTIEKWYEVYLSLKKPSKIPDDMLLPLYDDLNVPGYIANLHKLFEKANNGDDKEKNIFISACNFIGILNQTKEEWLNFKKKKSLISEKNILKKIKLRNKARENKDYKDADKIREELLDKGVLIEDKDGKTSWKIK